MKGGPVSTLDPAPVSIFSSVLLSNGFQLVPLRRGAAFSASDCNYAAPCFVTDPHRRVIFVPGAGGRDASGPSALAYCTVQFVVSDGAMLSVPADVAIARQRRARRSKRHPPRLRRRGQRRGFTLEFARLRFRRQRVDFLRHGDGRGGVTYHVTLFFSPTFFRATSLSNRQ